MRKNQRINSPWRLICSADLIFLHRVVVTVVVIMVAAVAYMSVGANCAGGGASASISPQPQSGVVYFLDDHQGNTHLVTDSVGNIAHEESRYPYGVKKYDQNTADNSDTVSESKPYYSYTGKEYDVETGLIYFGGRYYTPEIGRWITPDPLFVDNPSTTIDRPLEGNLYSYVRNNPMTFIDPIGYRLKFEKGASEDFRRQFAIALEYLKAADVAGPILELDARKETVLLREINTHKVQFDPRNERKLRIDWNPRSGLDVRRWPEGVAFDRNSRGDHVQTPALGLLHEAGHALGYLKDEMLPCTAVTKDAYKYAEEKRVLLNFEQPAAKKLDEPVRYFYGGQSQDVSCATCNE